MVLWKFCLDNANSAAGIMEIIIFWWNATHYYRLNQGQNSITIIQIQRLFQNRTPRFGSCWAKTFIRFFFYTAAFVTNHENINRIFANNRTVREIFRCIMRKQRFAFLLGSLAPISNILSNVSNSQALNSLGVNVTIDEMLVLFWGIWKYKV